MASKYIQFIIEEGSLSQFLEMKPQLGYIFEDMDINSVELNCEINLDDRALTINTCKVDGRLYSLNYLQYEQINELTQELCDFALEHLIDKEEL